MCLSQAQIDFTHSICLCTGSLWYHIGF